MSRFPPECLSENVAETVSKCPKNKTFVEEYDVTPVHVGLGLVPRSCPLSVFRDIRKEFLGVDHALLDAPEFVFIDTNSEAVDIKSYLLSVGVEQAKVDSLPETLTYETYLKGELGPGWDASELKS